MYNIPKESKEQKNKQIFGDPELIKWLNKEIKLYPGIIDLEKQFQNWFYFQEVLLKSGYPLTQILMNKFDQQATQKNIKIVKKHVIKMIGIEPKVEKNQSLIEAYLRAIYGVAKPILSHTLLQQARRETKDVLKDLTKTLKITDKHQVHSLYNNHEEKFINTLPPGAKRIEDKLQNFRDQKMIHEIKSVQLKQKEEEKEREWLQSLRQVEIEKITANHQFIKDQDKNIYKFWYNTEKIKHDRITTENKFNAMMTNRMKDAIIQYKKADFDDMQDNIHQFLQTCIRQGIEIEKDPTKKPVPEKAKFSAVATMMKIRERTRKNEEARKARSKRRNKMMVEQQKQQEEVEAKKKLDDLIHKYHNYGIAANKESQDRYTDIWREELKFKDRTVECQQSETKKEGFFEQLRKEAKAREQDLKKQAQQDWRKLQVQYMEQNYQRKVEKREKHNQQMQPLILSLLDLTDKCYLSMQNENGTSTLTLDNKVWKQFLEVWQGEVSQIKQTQDNVAVQITQEFYEYYNNGRDWKATIFDSTPFMNTFLGQYLCEIIDHLYPMQSLSADANFQLPLKISLIGGRFSGRKTTAKYLNLKYGLDIIDLESIIKESLKLANPPQEDPKKKKDTKKVIEVPVIENPELKAYGLEIGQYKDTTIPDELLVQGVLIKLGQLYGQRTPQLIAQEIREAEELQKKKESVPVEEVKKVSKKPGKKEVIQTGPSQDDLIKEYINSKQFYYTKGWVMIGFPENASQAKYLEQALSGYIPLKERLNHEAEERKKKISELLELPINEETTRIQASGTDLIIYLETTKEQRIGRMNQRRIDPATEIIYNLEDNAPPPEVKVDKLIKIEGENEEKLLKEIEEFDQNLEDLKQWCDPFGLTDQLKLFQTCTSNGKGLDVAKSIDNLIEKVIEINKEIFLQYLVEDEKRLETERQQTERQQLETEGGQEINEQNDKDLQLQTQLEEIEIDKINKHHRSEQSDYKLRSNTSQKGQREEYLSDDQLFGVLKQWDEISNSYVKETTIYIRRMNHQRRKCQSLFLQHQKQFLEMFETPDTKLEKLQQFQQCFNKFQQDNEDLSKQKNAKLQIKGHLQTLYEQLWDMLNLKKNQALEFIKNAKKERFVLTQIQQYMQHVLMLLQTETNLLTEISHMGKPWSEHFILEPPSAQMLDGYKIPQLDVLIKYYNDSLEQITQDEESQLIKIQKEIALKRGQVIYSVAYSKISEMLLMEDILFSRIDDWIIYGIKDQNDFCFQVFNYYKQCIEDREIALLTIPEPPPISEKYKMIYMAQHILPQNNDFRILVQLFEEMHFLCDGYLLKFSTFTQYIKANPKLVQRFNFNINYIQNQFLNEKSQINFNQLFIALILWDYSIPNQSDINKLLVDFKSVEPEFQEDYWCEYEFWFDNEVQNEIYDLKYFIKKLLFKLLVTSDWENIIREAVQPYLQQTKNQYFKEFLELQQQPEEQEES